MGGGGGEKKPGPPQHEIGGTDINLVSANKHSSGGKQPPGKMPDKGGSDAWLGSLPGMEPLKGLFAK